MWAPMPVFNKGNTRTSCRSFFGNFPYQRYEEKSLILCLTSSFLTRYVSWSVEVQVPGEHRDPLWQSFVCINS